MAMFERIPLEWVGGPDVSMGKTVPAATFKTAETGPGLVANTADRATSWLKQLFGIP